MLRRCTCHDWITWLHPVQLSALAGLLCSIPLLPSGRSSYRMRRKDSTRGSHTSFLCQRMYPVIRGAHVANPLYTCQCFAVQPAIPHQPPAQNSSLQQCSVPRLMPLIAIAIAIAAVDHYPNTTASMTTTNITARMTRRQHALFRAFR